MKNHHKELKNREITNMMTISGKAKDSNIKKKQSINKELFQINKAKIQILEKENKHKINKLIQKVKSRQIFDKYIENKHFNYKNFFHIFIFILLYLFLPLSLSYKTRKLYFSSIVNIFIKKTGNIKILSENFQTSPDKIVINTEVVDPNITSYEFITTNNSIILMWDIQLTNCSYMFSECSNIASIVLSKFDSSKCVNMGKMFYKCYELENLNISNLDTSSVTNMNNMFFGCEQLASIDVSNFNTSKVVNMDCLFVFCEKVEYLNLESFNTSSVNNMRSMFRGCYKLTSINLSKFNTSLVSRTQYMFKDCESLQYLDLSSIDTSNVRYMNGMFDGCTNLEEINLTNFNTSSVTEIMWMFQKCSKIKSLDLSSFDMSKVVNASCMFFNCEALVFVKFNNSNKMSEVLDISQLFYNCKQLSSVDLSFIYSSKITHMQDMFYNCMSIKAIDMQNLNTISVINMDNIFVLNYNLQFLNIYSFVSNSNIQYDIILGVLPYNLIYCLKDYEQTQDLILNFNIKYSKNNCTYICNYENKKIINETNSCIDECPLGTKSTINNLCVESLEETTTNLIDEPIISDNILKEEITFQKTEVKEEIDITYTDIKEEISLQEIDNFNSSILSTLASENIQEKEATQNTEFIKSTEIKFNFETTIPNIEVKEGSNLVTKITEGTISSSSDLKGEKDSVTEIKENYISSTYDLKEENDSVTQIAEDTILSTSELKEELAISTTEDKEETTSLTKETTEYIISQTNENKEITETELISTQTNIKETSTLNNKLAEEITIPSEIKKDIIPTNYLSQETTSYIEIKTDKGSIFNDEKIKTEIIEKEDYTIISGRCNVEEFLNKSCIENEASIEDKENIINLIKKNIVNKNLKSLLINVTNEEKQDLTVDYKDAIYQITSSDSQNNKIYNNISTIKLGECEKKLKDYYNLTQEESLLIFKVDVYEEGLIIPIVEYEIYHPYTLEKVDMEICEKEKVQISLPVDINEEDIDKYDPSSNYYNDKCCPSSSEKGVDIILIDRQNEFINNNLTLCENNCKFIGYNHEAMQALCECDIKNEINLISNLDIDKDKLISNFKDFKSMINLDIVKCYKILFTKKGLIKNIGSYILLSTIFLFIISLFIFIGRGYNYLKSQIRDIMMIKMKNMNSNKVQYRKVVSIKSKTKNKKQNKNDKNKNKSIKKNIKKIKEKVKSKASPKKNNKKNKNDPPLKKKKLPNNKNNSSITLKQITPKSQFQIEKSSSKLFISQKNMIVSKKRNVMPDKQISIFFCDKELNSLSYEEALIYDKRSYFQYYLSLLRTKHLLIFSFYPNKDYNSMVIKVCLFFFSFVLYLTVNTLFYTDSTIHNIYQNSGNFDLNYHIPQILYSTLISTMINMVVKSLSLSETNILELKRQNNYKKSQRMILIVLKCLKIKFILFFIVSFILLDSFWYYLSCFCAVYSNTQTHILKDTILSFCLSLIYPFCINIFPGFFRIRALKNSKHNQKCLYKTSKIIQLF